jgi:hypothetical protein
MTEQAGIENGGKGNVEEENGRKKGKRTSELSIQRRTLSKVGQREIIVEFPDVELLPPVLRRAELSEGTGDVELAGSEESADQGRD